NGEIVWSDPEGVVAALEAVTGEKVRSDEDLTRLTRRRRHEKLTRLSEPVLLFNIQKPGSVGFQVTVKESERLHRVEGRLEQQDQRFGEWSWDLKEAELLREILWEGERFFT